MTEEATDSPGYSEYKSQRDAYLNAYLDGVRKKIAQRAQELAKEKSIQPEVRHLAQASLDIAPGSVFPKTNEPTWWRGILSSITGITILSGVLAVIFGGLGLYLNANDSGADPTLAQGFLDIAKIFAGAVVGSAGESAVTRYRGR